MAKTLFIGNISDYDDYYFSKQNVKKVNEWWNKYLSYQKHCERQNNQYWGNYYHSTPINNHKVIFIRSEFKNRVKNYRK